jgi:hypothetical protein
MIDWLLEGDPAIRWQGVHDRFVGNQDHLRDQAAQMMPVWL